MATTCKLIAKVALGASASNIEFTSIPGTYTDLMLVASLRTDRSSVIDLATLRFNGETADTNTSCRVLRAAGPSTVASNSLIQMVYATAASATADTFGSGEVYLPNYAGSTAKSFSLTSVLENNSANDWYMNAVAGLWNQTAAITSIKLVPVTGPNFVSGSSAYLYGLTKS